MYIANGQTIRCFTVKIEFDRVIASEEFDKILENSLNLIINSGIAEKIVKGLKQRIATKLDDNENAVESTVFFIVDAYNATAPNRLRRSEIESVLQKEYSDADVSVLVD